MITVCHCTGSQTGKTQQQIFLPINENYWALPWLFLPTVQNEAVKSGKGLQVLLMLFPNQAIGFAYNPSFGGACKKGTCPSKFPWQHWSQREPYPLPSEQVPARGRDCSSPPLTGEGLRLREAEWHRSSGPPQSSLAVEASFVLRAIWLQSTGSCPLC